MLGFLFTLTLFKVISEARIGTFSRVSGHSTHLISGNFFLASKIVGKSLNLNSTIFVKPHEVNAKATSCSITLHVNYEIAVFVNFQVLTIAKTDTKVKNQVLTNIPHCSVDGKMVLRAQELAPSGLMLVILSLNASIYKQSKAFELLAPKRVWSRP